MASEINLSKKLYSNYKTPESIYASNGNFDGEIHLQWDAVDNAYHYIIESAPQHSMRWKQVDIICDSYYLIDGLKRGSIYLFRVAAVFAEGQGPWSKAVSKKVK